MILVYSPKNSSRITYSLGLLLDTLLGMSWEFAPNLEAFRGYEGPKINYGGSPENVPGMYIAASGLLSERSIRSFTPGMEVDGDLPLLFPSDSTKCSMGFDPFSAAFYMASRYEEYLPFQGDRFGRFEAAESFAFKNGFLGLPVVDHWAMRLGKALVKFYPGLVIPQRAFAFLPTIDVDVAYAYSGRGGLRILLGSLSSLARRDVGELKQRFRVLTGKEVDPFDTYDLQLAWHGEFGLKTHYFFLCGDFGPFDRNIAFYSSAFHRLVKRISDYAIVGLHPSFATGEDPQRLTTEVRRLSSILNREVRFSRQHYLRLQLPRTYQDLIRNNITHDFSMGFASRPGFRAGTCTPYFFYDLEKEADTNLKVFPLAVMDGTLRDYMGLGPGDAAVQIREIIRQVKQVNGTFISLWHNDSLSDTGPWKGWRDLYRELLELAAKYHGRTS
jgi:hypothetical protein